MGLFDRVLVKCNNCEDHIEFQSKAGNCSMTTYEIFDMPPAIAEDLDNAVEKCDNCGQEVMIKTDIIVYTKLEWL